MNVGLCAMHIPGITPEKWCLLGAIAENVWLYSSLLYIAMVCDVQELKFEVEIVGKVRVRRKSSIMEVANVLSSLSPISSPKWISSPAKMMSTSSRRMLHLDPLDFEDE